MIPMPGATELIIILVIVLVLFGPSQLPKIGKMLGQTSKSIREGMNGSLESDEKTEKKAKAKPAADEEADDEE